MTKLDLTYLRRSIEKGEVVLFLGSGASAGSLSSQGDSLLSTNGLASALAEEAGFEYNNEPLNEVYAASKQVLGTRIKTLLERNFRHCAPSEEYSNLARIPWARIYTTNIDDAFENALATSSCNGSPQRVRVQGRKNPLVDRDQTYSMVDIVKLHGSVDRLQEGVIFSPTEYAIEAATPSAWYTQLGIDYQNYSFAIIGSKLSEPLFYQQVQYARQRIQSSSPQSFLVVPYLSDLQKMAFTDHNIIHVPWTLSDFSRWVAKQFPRGLSYTDVAANNNPSIRRLLKGRESVVARRAEVLSEVVQVQPNRMKSADLEQGRIRNFYRGFKPTWADIADEIPAVIEDVELLTNRIRAAIESDVNCIAVYGPAGSGKSTATRMAVFEIARADGVPCFFSLGTNEYMLESLKELENAHEGKYVLICDRVEPCIGAVANAYQRGAVRKGLVVAVESQHAWLDRVKAKLVDVVVEEFAITRISKDDSSLILKKLEQYGPWTLLSRYSKKQREKILLNKSRRQLLIGLLEATQGIGFEKIIERDYRNLGTDAHRRLLVVVGLASMHRLFMPTSYAARVLEKLGIQESPAELLQGMEGVLYGSRGKLVARHPVYVRSLLESHISTDELSEIIQRLLDVFTMYDVPIIKSLSRNESHLYKKIINNRFLRSILRNSEPRILSIYQSLEKPFEQDGLYWLQYGLALRYFGHHEDALERLNTAVSAHEQPHTLHAFAHQQLIIALGESDTGRAERLAEEANVTLERLQRRQDYDDMYPINLLARGYTAFIRKTQGDTRARIIAKTYADRIYATRRTATDVHLKETWTFLTSYAVNGTWEWPNVSNIVPEE